MRCLDDKTVQAWVSHELPEPEHDVIRTHLDVCDSCRDLVAAVVEGAAPQTAGRYRLLEVVGGGAMGEVYRAYDPELGRDVAIKLVRPGGSKAQLLREAQAMARLAHPNVIRVYDVGTAGDRVFLAMELVRGRTLRAWFADAPRSWRAIVGVVREAGGGLAAAHAAGLVHGDFKPDNVLVADDGRVLVTDFGLARMQAAAPATDRAEEAIPLDHTRTGAFAGTPAYMAPEQLATADGAAPPTAATDQFALCVTLYEALYGRRPFTGSDLGSLRAALASGELDVSARRGVPGRVVRILRRGLARDPRDRYPALGPLLADLGAALSRRTLWVASGAAVVAGAVATTLAIAGGGGGPQCGRGAELLAGVWDEGMRARIERAFRATDVPYAATSLASVTGLLDRYRATWIAAHTETCEATHVRGEQSAALLDLRMQCLRRRRDDAAAVIARLVEGGREAVRDGVAAVTALPPISDCAHVSSLQDLAQPLDAPLRDRVRAIEGDTSRCRALLAAGQYRHAQACADDAVQRADGAGYGPALAAAALAAGQAALRLRAWPAAEAALDRALLAAETGRDARTRARALIALVSVATERAAFGEGRKHAEHAAAVIAGLGDDRVLAGDLAFATGVLALREGKLDEAATALGRAIALRERLHGRNDARVAEPLVPLAVVETTRRRDDAAKQLVDRALAIQRETLGDAHPLIGKTLHVAAQIEARVGQITEALASQRRAYELLVAAYGEEHHDVALTVGMAAHVYLIAGRYDEAVPHARRAAELMEKASGPDHPDTATALNVLGAVLNRSGATDAALAAHERALAIRMRALGEKHLHTTQSQVNVAMALRTLRRCEESLPLLHAARDTRVERFGRNHPEVVRVLQTIADCEVDLGRPQNAVAPLEEVLRMREAMPRRTADDRVNYAMASYGLARALWHDHAARERARALARRAHAELVALKDTRADGVATWAKRRGIALE